MQVKEKVALVTGGASGIGRATAMRLAQEGARAVALVDRSDAVQAFAKEANAELGRQAMLAFVGDVTDGAFRAGVYAQLKKSHGPVHICVPAAGVTRDRLAVKIDKATGKADIYPVELFNEVVTTNLVAPVYWALEAVASVAEDRIRRGLARWSPEEDVLGAVVLIGSVSSQGNAGQISYASAKAGLEGAASTLAKEAIYHGVRCAIIHPGFTDTPMVRKMDPKIISEQVLPSTQLRRLLRPEEIADAICFMVRNSAVSGSLWVDAGWHPRA